LKFLTNKYSRKYWLIIERGKTRGKATVRRRRSFKPVLYIIHHIVPRSFGGKNSYDNLVLLTHKEHFICHHLLTKMTSELAHGKMVSALYFMSNSKGYRCSARLYEQLALEYSELQSVLNSGVNNPHYGKTHSREAREIMSRKRTGFVWKKDDLEKMIRSLTGVPKSEEHCRNISNSTKGKPKTGKNAKGHKKSEEHKRNIALATAKYWASKDPEVIERKQRQGKLFSKLRKSGQVRTWNKKAK